MSEPVNIHAAKTQLSRLIERAERGEEVVIARAGRPVVKLVPLKAKAKGAPRRFGLTRGLVTLAPDYDPVAPLSDEEIKAWTDGPVFPGLNEDASPYAIQKPTVEGKR
jgi:prevent-host-death family protein